MPWANDQNACASSRIPGGDVPGVAGPLLQPGLQGGPVERPVGGQPVEVGRRSCPSAGTSGPGPAGRSPAAWETRPISHKRIGDQRELDRRLAREVLVDRRRRDAELVGQPAHGQRLRPFGLQQPAGDLDDLLGPRRTGRVARAAGRAGRRRDRGHQAESRKTGCFGAIRASSSALESASTPSKNMPTSAFQRLR